MENIITENKVIASTKITTIERDTLYIIFYMRQQEIFYFFGVDKPQGYVIITLYYFKESVKMKKNLKTPTNIVGKRRHGFRSKMAKKSGRKTLARRRQKGRKRLCI